MPAAARLFRGALHNGSSPAADPTTVSTQPEILPPCVRYRSLGKKRLNRLESAPDAETQNNTAKTAHLANGNPRGYDVTREPG